VCVLIINARNNRNLHKAKKTKCQHVSSYSHCFLWNAPRQKTQTQQREKLLDKLVCMPTFGDQSSKDEIIAKKANS
jgi:hypothetical protein